MAVDFLQKTAGTAGRADQCAQPRRTAIGGIGGSGLQEDGRQKMFFTGSTAGSRPWPGSAVIGSVHWQYRR